VTPFFFAGVQRL